MLRESYLQQNAYDAVDAVSGPEKSLLMLELIFSFYDEAEKALADNIPLDQIENLPIRVQISQCKRNPDKDFEKYYEKLLAGIFNAFDKLRMEKLKGGLQHG